MKRLKATFLSCGCPSGTRVWSEKRDPRRGGVRLAPRSRLSAARCNFRLPCVSACVCSRMSPRPLLPVQVSAGLVLSAAQTAGLNLGVMVLEPEER